ncbi:MAG: septation protein SpoVG family protein [bacterium]
METEKTIKRNELNVTEVRLSLYGKNGIIAFAEVILGNSLRLNDIAIKRTEEGKLFLSYPLKKTQSGSEYFYYNPISQEFGEQINNAIFDKLNEIRNEIYETAKSFK